MKKQVSKNHYDFSKYVHKKRWSSMWHQLDEISKLQPQSILEIGPGPGLFKAIAKTIGLNVETMDLDPELKPDHVASATEIPLEDNSYDVVCAFQMLEHLPFEKSIISFTEMCRVSKSHILISLPDAKTIYPVSIEIPRKGVKYFSYPKPQLKLRKHEFDGEHYWEINVRDYDEKTVISKMLYAGKVELIKNYRVADNPYHRFLLFKKNS